MIGLIALGAFAAGVLLVIAATEWLLDGLVGVAAALRVAPFVASVILSGMEAENIAVGLAAGHAAQPRSPSALRSVARSSCSRLPLASVR